MLCTLYCRVVYLVRRIQSPTSTVPILHQSKSVQPLNLHRPSYKESSLTEAAKMAEWEPHTTKTPQWAPLQGSSWIPRPTHNSNTFLLQNKQVSLQNCGHTPATDTSTAWQLQYGNSAALVDIKDESCALRPRSSVKQPRYHRTGWGSPQRKNYLTRQ